MTLQIPEGYIAMERLPEDPEGMDVFGIRTNQAGGVLQIYSQEPQKRQTKGSIIEGIHHSMNDDQGLVEVEMGKTAQGYPYYYSIVKNRTQPSGMIYISFLQIYHETYDQIVHGTFEEQGTTGIRDNTYFIYALKEGLIDGENYSGWCQDPYDETYKKGILRNLSEAPELDEAFPEHPLSMARWTIKYIVENN